MHFQLKIPFSAITFDSTELQKWFTSVWKVKNIL